jgi:hypothetical protein
MFKKAERKQVKIKLALTGPSGSGKTYSALLLASGLSQKIAVIDTENNSASLYSDLVTFDVMTLQPPYSISKYLAAINDAVLSGYDVLVIDSISHAWAGDGGLLAKKESLDARGGNSFSNWSSISKEHEAFRSALLSCNIHLIVTMRSKQDYVLEINDKGKQQPRKVGLAPIQRDGIEYEFTTVFDIAMNHETTTSKDRTGLFDGLIFKITSDTGIKILEWISQGKKVKGNLKKLSEALLNCQNFDELEKISQNIDSRDWTEEEEKEIKELIEGVTLKLKEVK